MEIVRQELHPGLSCHGCAAVSCHIKPYQLICCHVYAKEVREGTVSVDGICRLHGLRLIDLAGILYVTDHVTRSAKTLTEIHSAEHVVAEYKILHIRIHLTELPEIDIEKLRAAVITAGLIAGIGDRIRLPTGHGTPGKLCLTSGRIDTEYRQIDVIHLLPVRKGTEFLPDTHRQPGSPCQDTVAALRRCLLDRKCIPLHFRTYVNLAQTSSQKLLQTCPDLRLQEMCPFFRKHCPPASHLLLRLLMNLQSLILCEAEGPGHPFALVICILKQKLHQYDRVL